MPKSASPRLGEPFPKFREDAGVFLSQRGVEFCKPFLYVARVVSRILGEDIFNVLDVSWPSGDQSRDIVRLLTAFAIRRSTSIPARGSFGGKIPRALASANIASKRRMFAR